MGKHEREGVGSGFTSIQFKMLLELPMSGVLFERGGGSRRGVEGGKRWVGEGQGVRERGKQKQREQRKEGEEEGEEGRRGYGGKSDSVQDDASVMCKVGGGRKKEEENQREKGRVVDHRRVTTHGYT